MTTIDLTVYNALLNDDGSNTVGTLGTKAAILLNPILTPVQTAVTALDAVDALKAPLASPTFTGTPAAPTAAVGTNTTQLATTAFVRTLTGVRNVKDYGAVGNDSTDDTTAINAAIAALPAAGGRLFFPAGTYKITAELPITTAGGAQVFGEGIFASAIKLYTNTQYGFRVQALGAVSFRDLSVLAGTTKTAGAGIELSNDGSGTWNTYSEVVRCYISAQYIGVDVVKASNWNVLNSAIYNAIIASVKCANTLNGDAGGGMIMGCTLLAQSASKATSGHVYFVSGGGLRVTDNFIYSGAYGVNADLVNGLNTSVLIISGNEIDACETSQILIQRTAGTPTGAIALVNIQDNTLGGLANAAGLIAIASTAGTAVAHVVIEGNNINLANNNLGVNVSGGTGVLVDDNMITSSGTGTVGIQVASTAADVTVGLNNKLIGTFSGGKKTNASTTSTLEGDWITYTPTWGNTGTANTLGNGSLAGGYRIVGTTLQFRVALTWGSTTASGSGAWTFTFPFTVSTAGSNIMPFVVYVADASVGTLVAFGKYFTTTTWVPSGPNAVGGFGTTAPMTWVNTDAMYAFGTAELP